METVPIVVKCIFGVRHDKHRGILVETLETADGNVYFFKMHDQPISKHCQQMQNIAKLANVQRARKLHIDITTFAHEYFRITDKAIVFRGTKLTSAHSQVEKTYTMRLNKEMGIVKRQQTMAANKQAKILAHNQRIVSQMIKAEEEFQAERARRIHQLFGAEPGASGSQAASGGVAAQDEFGGEQGASGSQAASDRVAAQDAPLPDSDDSMSS